MKFSPSNRPTRPSPLIHGSGATRTHAQGHISEGELDVYLVDLKTLTEAGTGSADRHHAHLASIGQAAPGRGRRRYARSVWEA